MSHDFSIYCKCGARSNDWSHAERDLVEAVEAAGPLYAFKDTGWSVNFLLWDGVYDGLAPFLVEHFDHGGFTVVGEYSSDIPVPCQPKMPEGEYQKICLRRLEEDVKQLEQRLADLRRELAEKGLSLK